MMRVIKVKYSHEPGVFLTCPHVAELSGFLLDEIRQYMDDGIELTITLELTTMRVSEFESLPEFEGF